MGKNTNDLSFEERQAIVEKYHSGDPIKKKEAVEEMIIALDDYIYYIIHRRFARYLNMIEDLSQAGRMAIVEYMGKYKPEFKPTTYFSFHIQNALQEIVNIENGESHYYAESKNMIVKTMRKLGMDMDNLDEQMLAIHMNMTQSRLHSILEKTLHKKQIELIEDTKETSNEYFDSPENAYVKSEMEKEFRDCLNQLDEVENIVLCMHFGFYHPVFNQEEKEYKISSIQKMLTRHGIDVNAVNVYRSARRHITEILYDAGIVQKRNRYQSAKDDAGFKFFDPKTANEMFEALNEVPDDEF